MCSCVQLHGGEIPTTPGEIPLLRAQQQLIHVRTAFNAETVPLIGNPVPLIRGGVAVIGDPVAPIRSGIAIVRKPVPLVSVGLPLAQPALPFRRLCLTIREHLPPPYHAWPA